LAVQHQVTPRELATEQITAVHRALVRADASVLGVPHTDPEDAALTAQVGASSTLRTLAAGPPTDTWPLTDHLGLVLPADPTLAPFWVLLDADADTELVVEVHQVARPKNYLPHHLVKSVTVSVPAGERQWVNLPLAWELHEAQNAFVVVRANEHVRQNNEDGP